MMPFLVHAYGAVHTVVDYQHDQRSTVFGGRGQLLRVHQKTAITGHTHYLTIWVTQRRRYRGRQAVSHGAARWGQFGAPATILIEPVQPYRVVAGTVGKNGVVRQGSREVLHHCRHVHALVLRRQGRRSTEGFVGTTR